MAGSPRTLPEGKDQVPFLKELFGAQNIKIVLIEISPEETMRRNSRRRICQLMRHPILSTEKQFLGLKNCPLDGSKLLKNSVNNLVKFLNKNLIKNYEIILVNDGSIDNTLDIAKNLINQKINSTKVTTTSNGTMNPINPMNPYPDPIIP